MLFRLISFASVFAILICSSISWSRQIPAQPAKEPVATIAGQPIYEDELLPAMSDQLQQLRNQEYQIKSRTLEKLIDQKLLEAEGKKRGIPADQVENIEVDSKIADPTDAEVEAYYLGQGNRSRSLDEVKAQLRESLKQAKLDLARQEFMQRLWREYNVGILLSAPKADVGFDAARVRGPADAPITIVEFSDFQCPFCRSSYPVMKELLSKYAGKIKVAYRDFPLREIHPQAQIAAEAARCATEQGKFWEYHDLLFSNPDKLDAAGLLELARQLSLNETQFENCLATGKFRPAIEADRQAGVKARVSGTPAFFINGIPLSGAQPASVFEKTIDAELSRMNQLHQTQ